MLADDRRPEAEEATPSEAGAIPWRYVRHMVLELEVGNSVLLDQKETFVLNVMGSSIRIRGRKFDVRGKRVRLGFRRHAVLVLVKRTR